ncbi:MAG TPA: FHA domain-containing protein [Ktedonobacteraceae bacterium]|nr:FHA domain-containing protein [Ktedonobacteraceae bacterium]
MSIVQGSPISGTIQFLSGPLKGTTYTINKPVIAIGREPANDVVISDPAVSRQHAQLIYNNGIWSIRKLASQNTVTVNKKEVQQETQETLNNGDIVVLGAVCTFRFLPGSAQEMAAPPSQPPMVTRVVPNVPPPPPHNGGELHARPSFAAPLPESIAVQPPPSIVGPFGTESMPPAPRQNAGPFGTEPAAIGGTMRSQQTPSIEVRSNTHHEKKVYSLANQVINIGRAPAPENDIVIDENVISGQHLQIVHDGNHLVLIHPHPKRKSTLNGLLYNGQLIRGDQPFRKILARGDIFRIGDEHGTLVTLTYNDGSGAVQEPAPELRPIPLNSPRITIGRHPDNMVVLNHPQISSHHASIEQVQGGHRISDLRSTNGVFVNGQRTSNHLLRPGDEVRIGPFKLTYTGTQLTQQDEGNGIRIDALHLKKVGNKQVVILNDISIVVPPRKFVALVGGSGAGKSTLMDALNGLRPAQQGSVLYNGQDYYKNLAAFSTQLGYVPQDDIIHRDLTVERALHYAAKLRLPADFTDTQIKQRIDEVLEDVDLTRRRKLLVSKLSGGQRKRVSIALELLANPSVFFLDEPTSGLDPGLDRKMMFLLRKLADKGHTIVLVTHATNNINSCDYICFLAQGGRVAYYGPPEEAKTYFGKADFAEIYSTLEPTDDNPRIPEEAEMRFKASPEYKQYVEEPLMLGPARRVAASQSTSAIQQPRRGNPVKQFWLLSQRYLELLWNDKVNFFILILQAPVIGLILLFLTGQGTFNPSSIATCPPQQGIPNTSGNKFSCQNVVNALNAPQGQVYMQQHHFTTVNQAVQSFIPQGSGGDAQKILFIIAFSAVMFGCINGAREIVKESAIYKRERSVNLGIAPYMFSKIAVLGVLCLLQSAVLVLFVNARAPFQWSVFLPPVVEIYITTALTALAGLMLGLTVSAIAPNNDRAMSFVPLILIPQVIFSGIIFSLNNPLLQFLGSFFAARWAMAGMGSTVGLHGDKLGSGQDFAYVGTLFSTNSQGVAVAHLLLMWLALIVMILVLGIFTAYFLKKKDVRV